MVMAQRDNMTDDAGEFRQIFLLLPAAATAVKRQWTVTASAFLSSSSKNKMISPVSLFCRRALHQQRQQVLDLNKN
jgi:hypothetical protein